MIELEPFLTGIDSNSIDERIQYVKKQKPNFKFKLASL